MLQLDFGWKVPGVEMDTKDEADLRNLERSAQSFLKESLAQEMMARLKPILVGDQADAGQPEPEPEPEPHEPEPEPQAQAELEAEPATESVASMPVAQPETTDEVVVKFTQEGSIGLDLAEVDPRESFTVSVTVKGVKEGTQATSHPEIRPGMTVVRVGGTDCRGMSLDDVVDHILEHSARPLEFCFVEQVEEGVPTEPISKTAVPSKPLPLEDVPLGEGSTNTDYRARLTEIYKAHNPRKPEPGEPLFLADIDPQQKEELVTFVAQAANHYSSMTSEAITDVAVKYGLSEEQVRQVAGGIYHQMPEANSGGNVEGNYLADEQQLALAIAMSQADAQHSEPEPEPEQEGVPTMEPSDTSQMAALEAQLTAMGFTEAEARAALSAAGGDIGMLLGRCHAINTRWTDLNYQKKMDSPELDVRAQLQKIYTEHSPRKVQDIDKLLEEHAGKEGELLAKVEAKYLAPALAKRAWLKDPDKKRAHAKARVDPRWIPDSERDRCMLCAAEFFGAGLGSRMAGVLGLSAANTTSRHHCRYCGWVVCGTCSPEKVEHPSKPGVTGPQVLAVDRWVSSTDGHPIRILEDDTKEKRVCISCLEHAPAEVAERRRVWRQEHAGSRPVSASDADDDTQAATSYAGFMEKKGEGDGDDFLRRWFELRGTTLLYFDKRDGQQKGAIELVAGRQVRPVDDSGDHVADAAASPSTGGSEKGDSGPVGASFGFELVTNERVWQLRCEDEESRAGWIAAISAGKAAARADVHGKE